MSLFDLTVSELRDRTASAAPTPGGGSVACVSATLGLALVVMAVEVTAKSSADAEILDWLVRARRLLEHLSTHADRDVEVFESYMRAFGLPRDDDAQKADRKAAIAEALITCTSAPLAAAADMVEALRLGKAIAHRVKKGIRSDVLAGADLLAGATQAVLRGVDVNLASMRDEPRAPEFADERARIAIRANALREEIIEIVARLG
jgi:formiminotetrahydrofolate cyclodeaminase